MKFVSFIFVFVYIYLEISVFIKIANAVGVLFPELFLVISSILGIFIIKSQGVRHIVQMQRKLQIGQNPGQEIAKSVLIFIGGILLFIPGFITDLLGAILLIPFVQKLIMKHFFLRLVIKKRYSYTTNTAKTTTNDPKPGEDIVEGVFIRKDDE